MYKISPADLKAIKKILKNFVPDCEVRVFGSRVNGSAAKKYSDLDLVIVGEKRLVPRKWMDLKDAFQESGLPFRVDVSDGYCIPANFKKVIDAKYQILQKRTQMNSAH